MSVRSSMPLLSNFRRWQHASASAVVAVVLVLGAMLSGPARAGAYEDFFEAVALDDTGAVQRLLGRGFDPNSVDPQGHPALTAALREKSWKVAALLLSRPAIDLERANPQDETALMIAAHQGHRPTVEALLRRGAQPNRPGWTALHYAASAGHDAVARLLLESNAYIDAESPNGTTPLMMASRHGHSALARMLVEEGADPRPRNQAGLSAADYFERGGDRSAADWMRQQARTFGSGPTGRAANAPAGTASGSTAGSAGVPSTTAPAAAAASRARNAARPGSVGDSPAFAGFGPETNAARVGSAPAPASPSAPPSASQSASPASPGSPASLASPAAGAGSRPSATPPARLPGQRAAPPDS